MEIVVFIPGILGSSLATPAGEEVWPPRIGEILTGYGRIDKLLQNDLKPTGVIEQLCIDVYGPVLNALRGFGYTANGGAKRLIAHAYDWRRDLRDLAAELDTMLDGLVQTHGAGLQIKIVCHSMGGLVTRCCLESPGAQARPWAAALKLAVFLATPHEGAPLAFARAIGVGGSSMGLNEAQLRRLSEAPGYPADYQLFPPPHLQPIWDLGSVVPLAGRSLFDPATVATYQLSQPHLAAASALHAGLDPARRPAGCRYFSVVSAAHATVQRFDEDYGKADPVEIKSTGDGTVPVRSAAALPVQTAYVDANHLGVTQKGVTHRLLGMLLGAIPAAPIAAATRDGANLSLSQRIIAEGEPLEIVVTRDPADDFAGEIHIRREIAGGALETVDTLAVAITAPRLTSFDLEAPRLTVGRYVFELVMGGTVVDTEELLVSRATDA